MSAVICALVPHHVRRSLLSRVALQVNRCAFGRPYSRNTPAAGVLGHTGFPHGGTVRADLPAHRDLAAAIRSANSGEARDCTCGPISASTASVCAASTAVARIERFVAITRS